MGSAAVSSEHAFFEALRARRRWVPATLLFVTINVALFVWRVKRGIAATADPDWRQLVQLGASYGPLSTDGERWRLFTSTFVHRDYVHLGYNVAFLAVLGRYVERIYGSVAFAAIYLVSSLVAAVAITTWGPLHVTYGASGGVAGVAGALMAFTVRRRLDVDELVRRRLRNAGLFLIGFGALAGLLNRRVSDVGHMTGLAVGFALGLALASPSLAQRTRALLLGASLALAVAGMFVLPRIWDVAAEGNRADAAYAALTVRYADAHTRRAKGALSEDAFTEFIVRDALPSLAHIREQLLLVRARGDEADLLQALVRLVQAREAQLTAVVGASRSHDPADENRAEALQREAERLSDEYRARR